jgi:CRISPR-associated protein Cas1
MSSHLNEIGLDPYHGFFHTVRYGHAALASDLLEEFRALIGDDVVLKLLRR